MRTETTFTDGQLVRLTQPYRAKRLTFRDSYGTRGPKPDAWFPVGERFSVFANRRLESRRDDLASGTVLVKNEAGTWCIPARLLELVPTTEQQASQSPPSTQQPQPPEGVGRDSQGDRVG